MGTPQKFEEAGLGELWRTWDAVPGAVCRALGGGGGLVEKLERQADPTDWLGKLFKGIL